MTPSSEFLIGQTVWLFHLSERCLLRELIDFAENCLVYRAERADGAAATVHWYTEASPESAHGREISQRIAAGAPDPSWLWPIDLALHQAEPGFGVVLPVAPESFVPLPLLAYGSKDSLSLTTRLQMGYAICEAIKTLHGRDLRLGGFTPQLIRCDPATGAVRLDGANVVTGDEKWRGTPRYLAPELLRGDLANGVTADLYLLGLILFELLAGQHALEGAQLAAIESLDLAAMRRLYGSEARFIFAQAENDPAETVEGTGLSLVRLWHSFPGSLREAFTQAFTAGLADPTARLSAAKWSDRLRALPNRLFPCLVCGTDNFLPDRKSGTSAAVPRVCWSCGEAMPIPLRLELGSDLVALNLGRKVTAGRLGVRDNVEELGAEVVPHPSQAGTLGLRNHTAEPWKATHPSASAPAAVSPGQAVRLEPGLRIRFRPALEGLVR